LISGGELRWKVAQDVLFLSRRHFKYLSNKYAKSIDYQPNKEYPQAFPHFRLLIKDDSYTELCQSVSSDILNNKGNFIKILPLTEDERRCVKTFLLEKDVEKVFRKEIGIFFNKNANLIPTLLILRGYFVYEILFNALSKRWKVEYGFNFVQKRLLQAVPYRAKGYNFIFRMKYRVGRKYWPNF
jgi:hypothetical protein